MSDSIVQIHATKESALTHKVVLENGGYTVKGVRVDGIRTEYFPGVKNTPPAAPTPVFHEVDGGTCWVLLAYRTEHSLL